MKNRTILILTAVLCCLIAGCGEQAQKQTVLPEGLTLEDIKPVEPSDRPVNIHMRLMTFEMLKDRAEVLTILNSRLSNRLIRPDAPEALAANGFRISRGQLEQWNGVAGMLAMAGAQNRRNHVAILNDGEPQSITAERITKGESVFYTNPKGGLTGKELGKGRLVWSITADASEHIRGTADIRIVPKYTKNTSSRIARLAGLEFDDAVEFSSSAFTAKMDEEEFLLIGPDVSEMPLPPLSRLYFSRIGDFVLTEPSKDEQKDMEIHSNVTMLEDAELIKIYVLFCLRVEN